MSESDLENLEIQPEEILTGDELNTEPEVGAEEVRPEPDTEPESEADPEDVEIDDPDDALVQALSAANDALAAAQVRIDTLEQRLTALEAQEAARARKLSGFFAPVKTEKEPGDDPLPRIERQYKFN